MRRHVLALVLAAGIATFAASCGERGGVRWHLVQRAKPLVIE